MSKLPVLLLQTCAIILINIDMLVPILASNKPTHMDRFLVENHRTRRKENYVLERALSNDIENNDNTGMTYATELLEPNTNPEELPALIVDYANMIRNDIILLDNSVETRTRKRGNVKVQRRNKEAALQGQCTCEQQKTTLTLGDNYFPRKIETTSCNFTLCAFPYGCELRYHNLTVLKAKSNIHEISPIELHSSHLKKNWVAVNFTVVVGCYCTREHVDNVNTDYIN